VKENRLRLDHESGLLIEGETFYSREGRVVDIRDRAERITLRNCDVISEVSDRISAGYISARNVTLDNVRFKHIGPGGEHGLYAHANKLSKPDGLKVINRCSFTGFYNWGMHCNNEGNGYQPKDMVFTDLDVADCGGGFVLAMGLGTFIGRLRVARTRGTNAALLLGYPKCPSYDTTLGFLHFEDCLVGVRWEMQAAGLTRTWKPEFIRVEREWVVT
jgi:hypothetical protein